MNKTALENKKLKQDAYFKRREAEREDTRLGEERVFGKKGRIGTAIDATKTIASLFSGSNDPKWYKRFIDNGKDVLNIPSAHTLGPATSKVNRITGEDDDIKTIPGILNVRYLNSIGAQSPDDASLLGGKFGFIMNTVMTNIRKLNSRIGEYEPPELYLYFNAAIEIFTHIARIHTGLKALISYDTFNEYTAKGIAAAKFGLQNTDDIDAILSKRANYIAMLNDIIQTANAMLVIPKELSIALRRIFLEGSVVSDCDLRNKQYYLFTKCTMCRFLDTENAIIPINVSDIDLDEQFTELRTDLAAISDSPTLVSLVADLRAAFPADHLLKYPLVTMDEKLTIKHDTEMLMQVHNAASLPRFISSGLRVDSSSYEGIAVSENGFIYQGYRENQVEPISDSLSGIPVAYLATQNVAAVDALVNMLNELSCDYHGISTYSDEFNQDDALITTRFRQTYVRASVNSGTAHYIIVKQSGSEVIYRFESFMYNDGTNTYERFAGWNFLIYNGNGTYPSYSEIQRFDSFSYRPTILAGYFEFREADNYVDAGFTAKFGQWGNVFPIAESNLDMINTRCQWSLYWLDSSDFVTKFSAR